MLISKKYCEEKEMGTFIATCLPIKAYRLFFDYGVGGTGSWMRLSLLIFLLSLDGWLVTALEKSNNVYLKTGLLFSIDKLLPIINLSDWHKDVVLKSEIARWYFAFHTLAGWAIGAFLVAWFADLIG